MALDQRDKELAAIGASVGCNCRPCVEHHLAAGRETGLSDAELDDAVAVARAVRDEGIELLASVIDRLLGAGTVSAEPARTGDTSRAQELVAIGASIGVNSHALLRRHIEVGLEVGLSPAQMKAAARMASYVQHRAAEITADKASHAVEEAGAFAGALPAAS